MSDPDDRREIWTTELADHVVLGSESGSRLIYNRRYGTALIIEDDAEAEWVIERLLAAGAPLWPQIPPEEQARLRKRDNDAK